MGIVDRAKRVIGPDLIENNVRQTLRSAKDESFTEAALGFTSRAGRDARIRIKRAIGKA